MTRAEMIKQVVRKLDQKILVWERRIAKYVEAKKAVADCSLPGGERYDLRRLQRAEFDAERSLHRGARAVAKEALFLRYLQKRTKRDWKSGNWMTSL